jgi:hypothetical protein
LIKRHKKIGVKKMSYNNIRKITTWTRKDLHPSLQNLPVELQDAFCANLNQKAQARSSGKKGLPSVPSKLSTSHVDILRRNAENYADMGNISEARAELYRAIVELTAIVNTISASSHGEATSPVTPKPSTPVPERSQPSYPQGRQHGSPLSPEQTGVVKLQSSLEQNAADLKKNAQAMGGVGQTTFESGAWAASHGIDNRTPEQRTFDENPAGYFAPQARFDAVMQEGVRLRKVAAEDYIASHGGRENLTDQDKVNIRKLLNGDDLQR